MQEVSVAAIEQKSPLRDKSAITAWLYQLAVRQALQFRRQLGRQRKRVAEAAAIEETKQHQTTEPLAWLLSTERREFIREGLGLLSGEDREILILKYIEGWSYRQIAERTNRTDRAIESQMHRARRRLREHLTRLNVIEERGTS